MKKFSICLMMMAFILVLTACGQQKREKEDLQNMLIHRTYLYEKEGCGNWVLDDDILVLSDDAEVYAFVNRFKVDGSDLVFLSKDSTNFLYVKVADGERFTGTSDEGDE